MDIIYIPDATNAPRLVYVIRSINAYVASLCLQSPILVDCSWPRPRRLFGAIAVDSAIQPLEGGCAEGHDHGADNKQSNSALEWDLLKDGVRIPSIMLEALLNPKPIAKSNGARQTQRRNDSNRPGR